jgi:hypothetical protein
MNAEECSGIDQFQIAVEGNMRVDLSFGTSDRWQRIKFKRTVCSY